MSFAARDKTMCSPLSTNGIEARILLVWQQLCSHFSHPSHALYFLSHSFILMRYVHSALSRERQRAPATAELDKLLRVVRQPSVYVYVQCTLLTHLAPGRHAVNKYCALHIQNEVGTFFTPVQAQRLRECVSVYTLMLGKRLFKVQ